ncbi:MAG: winged helix-turn-helix domain-containing protein [Pseudomonadota bacterium]
MSPAPRPPGLRLRLDLGGGARFGPGRARLLELIAETGSIAAAGRRMGMSYKRAWSLVEAMNAEFGAPLVASARGGASGGGAQVTALGVEAAAIWRRLEARAAEAVEPDAAALRALRRAGGE